MRKRNLESETMFDSIESMNAEELLVKRKKGTKRYLFFVAFACALFFVIGILVGYFATGNGGDSSGGDSGSSTGKFNYTKFILDNINKSRIRETLRRYSSQPRLAGTALDEDLATGMAEEWRAGGLDSVHLASYPVLLSFPNTSVPNVIQLLNSTDDVVFESHKYEVPLTPHENNSHVVPPFNGYSPPGNITGDLVYVNYGRIEDFYFLTNQSINVTGKVVIIRYGKIFRGDKVANAERFKASAVILYSDPEDVNLGGGEDNSSYPHSWWLPPSGIQRGTTLLTDGDPQTPLYPSTDYAYRLSSLETDLQLPKIPCQPIGYNDAQVMLSIMGGQQAPDSWQGGLNFSYHIGPGFGAQNDSKVRVVVNNYLEVKPVHNVIGYIKGSEEPDRYVLLGNHHDAWVFGAVDPLSGSAALTEIALVLGNMLRQGHRPRRTVVLCSWDAEEYGLLGSMEWVEDHLKVLGQRGVVYLNVDIAAYANYTLNVGTSPLLQDAVYQAATLVPSPDPTAGKTLYDLWKARPSSNITDPSRDPYLTYSLGSGSDMAGFYQRAGVSSVDMSFIYDQIRLPLSSYPLYHSAYETFFAYDSYIDPGFTATEAITRFWAILASEVACEELLPFKVERYSAAVTTFHQSLLNRFQDIWHQHNVSTDAFTTAVNNFTEATKAFQAKLDAEKKSILKNPLALRRMNDRLMLLERVFLDPEGLPGRPNQKHVLFAPSQFDAYVDTSFPGISDTMWEITHGQGPQGALWEQLKKQVFIATHIVQSAAVSLKDMGL